MRPSCRSLTGVACAPRIIAGGCSGLESKRLLSTLRLATGPELIGQLAAELGSSTVVASIDVRRRLLGKYEVCTRAGKVRTGREPVAWARELEDRGVGEIMLTAMDRDGTMSGYDVDLVRSVTAAVSVPVVACGGAGTVSDLGKVVVEGHAAAAAAGSLFVFKGRHRAVLISFPSAQELGAAFEGS